jgi:uncharacterized membrane protein
MISSLELQSLVTQGLLSEKQAAAILAYQLTQKPSWWGFSHSIMTIGAMLVGLGILSLVALNRDGMQDIIKIITLLITMTASYLLWWYFKIQQKSFLWGTLLFLSGLICGANIFLIAQIYNLTWTNDVLLAIWIVMILPLVYVLRQKEFYWLYMILLSCVIGQFLMSHVFQTVDDRTTFVLYIIFGLCMILIWLIHDYLYDDHVLARLYKVFGIHISMIAYWIFIIISDVSISDAAIQGYHFQTRMIWSMIGLWIGYLIWYFLKKDIKFLWGFAVFFILFFALEQAQWYLLSYVIFIIFCMSLIFIGYQTNTTSIIKTANAYLYLFLLYLYGKYGREYENKALFFIIGGVLMIGLGLWFQKLNKVIERILYPNALSHDK